MSEGAVASVSRSGLTDRDRCSLRDGLAGRRVVEDRDVVTRTEDAGVDRHTTSGDADSFSCI